MIPALYILHLVDDFGNQIAPCDLPYELYMMRYNYFMLGHPSDASSPES
jgi:hypothetical protein